MRKIPSSFSLPLFILWPFGSFLLALTNIRSKVSAIVYILFSALFGYAFTFESTGADSYRIALVFKNYTQTSSIQDTIALFNEGGLTDVYLRSSYVFIKQFTDNPKILFAWFGLVFGIFSYLSLRLLINAKIGKNTKMLFMIALVFFSFYPLSTVNGVRFNTAALVFFCSVVNVFVYKRYTWILGLVGTIFIHFSFILAVPVIIALWFLLPYFSSRDKKFKWVYVVFFTTLTASIFIPTNFFSIGFLQDSDAISSSVARKFDNYTSDEATALRSERLETSLFLNVSKYFGYVIKVFILFLVVQIKRKSKIIHVREEYRKFYYIILLFMSFGFIASSVPSGHRFLSIGYMFFYFLFYHIYDANRIKSLQKYIYLMPIVYSFQILYVVGFLSVSLTQSVIWYGNLIWVLFF